MSALPSFAESDYDIEDWIPIADSFDEHPRLEPRGAFENHADTIRGDVDSLSRDLLSEVDERELDQLENPDQSHEMELFYNVSDTSGEVATWYSPSARAEGNMLEGVLTYPSGVTGLPVAEVQKTIVDEYSTPYIQTNEDLGVEDDVTLASLRVPENYDPETLEDTVQAIVNIYDETARFDDTVTEAVENYEIN